MESEKKYQITSNIINSIEIKESTIAGAGLGAFAKDPFYKDEIIDEYIGEHISKKKFFEIINDKKNESNNRYGYILEITDKQTNKVKYIDAYDINKSNWCRYINHYPNDSKPNVEFTIDGKIKVIQFINEGDELFIDYGPDYWSMFPQIKI